MRIHQSRKNRGAAAAELACVLPFVVLVALGCVDFGRFAYTNTAVQNAARAGCGYGIMNSYVSGTKSSWDSGIQTAARNEMTNQTGYTSTNLTTTTTVTVEGKTGLRRCRVVADYKYFNTIITWPGIPSKMEISAACEMRVIR